VTIETQSILASMVQIISWLGYSMVKRKRKLTMDTYLHGNSNRGKQRGSKSNQQNHSKPISTHHAAHQMREKQKIDLHNFGLHQAKKRIQEECRYAADAVTIVFIHGHNHGTQIRDYIRNGQLAQSLDDQGIKGDIWYDAPGTTYFNRIR